MHPRFYLRDESFDASTHIRWKSDIGSIDRPQRAIAIMPLDGAIHRTNSRIIVHSTVIKPVFSDEFAICILILVEIAPNEFSRPISVFSAEVPNLHDSSMLRLIFDEEDLRGYLKSTNCQKLRPDPPPCILREW
jgi:hypothetical protein